MRLSCESMKDVSNNRPRSLSVLDVRRRRFSSSSMVSDSSSDVSSGHSMSGKRTESNESVEELAFKDPFAENPLSLGRLMACSSHQPFRASRQARLIGRFSERSKASVAGKATWPRDIGISFIVNTLCACSGHLMAVV